MPLLTGRCKGFRFMRGEGCTMVARPGAQKLQPRDSFPLAEADPRRQNGRGRERLGVGARLKRSNRAEPSLIWHPSLHDWQVLWGLSGSEGS